jgi:hypothetical protein
MLNSFIKHEFEHLILGKSHKDSRSEEKKLEMLEFRERFWHSTCDFDIHNLVNFESAFVVISTRIL